jgi:hypothetical protein
MKNNMEERVTEAVSSKKEGGKLIVFSSTQEQLMYDLNYELSEAYQSMLYPENDDQGKKAQAEYEILKAQAERLNTFFGYMVVNIPE